MKQIYATWKGYEVQVHSLSHLPGRVNVSTTDGSQPFSKYYAGAGCGMEAQGLVFLDDLENMRVVDDAPTLEEMNAAIARADTLLDELHNTLNLDPFDAGDCQPEIEPEYDPADEWFRMIESMRRGG